MAMSLLQRRVVLARLLEKFENGASIEHVLGEAWNAGFIEGDRDTDVVELEFDRRVNEINRDIEAERAGVGL